MSVTFFMPNHQIFRKYDNPSYNPEEPEDSMYNPKELEEEIYPYLNVSNANAGVLLRKLNLYDEELVGSVPKEEMDSFIEFLKGFSTNDPIDENCERVSGYINRLLILARTAKALDDCINWG
jgi:hypothetical protein